MTNTVSPLPVPLEDGVAPAFPKTIYENKKPIDETSGLTKREYAAIQLLSGFVANGCHAKMEIDEMVRQAVDLSQKLVDELEGEG